MVFPISIQKGCKRRNGDVECFSGVAMDCDVFHEGYQKDVIYPPCPCHPKHCKPCRGQGLIEKWKGTNRYSIECKKCKGTGWLGDAEHPDDRYADNPNNLTN